jgi:hypothetical protein
MAEMRSGLRYRYVYTQHLADSTSEFGEASKDEIQRFVNASLGLMTGGCEVCQYSRRMYCEKFRRPINVGDVRCESFARRPAASTESLV